MNLEEIAQEIESLETYNGCITEEYYNRYFIALKALHNQRENKETQVLFTRMTELYKRVRAEENLWRG